VPRLSSTGSAPLGKTVASTCPSTLICTVRAPMNLPSLLSCTQALMFQYSGTVPESGIGLLCEELGSSWLVPIWRNQVQTPCAGEGITTACAQLVYQGVSVGAEPIG
jgi:hypothetical protein